MTDPYKVLNVSPTATDEEVKRAYRALARKYHPDNYQGTDLADLANDKMKEINEAYDTIRRERMQSRAGQNYAGAGTSGTTGGSTSRQSSGTTAERLARVRNLIHLHRMDEAGVILQGIPENERGAEWQYLWGCFLYSRGWSFDAQKAFEAACYLDPTNTEYRQALERLQQQASAGGQVYPGSDCSGCDICSGLICADCLCEGCGFDLIRCI